MAHKLHTVTALVEFEHRGQTHVPGEVFEVSAVDAVVLSSKKRVCRTTHAQQAQPQQPSRQRRGTYRRRDLVAEPR